MPRKKIPVPISTEETEAFIVTTTEPIQKQEYEKQLSEEEFAKNLLDSAMKTYDYDKKQSSAFLNEVGNYTTPTLDELAQLAEGAQDNLTKVLRINSIISKYANLDDVVGMIVDALGANLNDEYRLSYSKVDGRNKNKKSERAKEVIEQFNDEVDIKGLIREQIQRAYLEGTSIMYLRRSEDSWSIDTYPLGVVSITPYKVGGEPTVILDITELKNRLQKATPRTRSGKSMYYDTLDAEILSNYSQEVYEAFKAKETQVKLDPRYARALRIGNRGRRYGVSPILRALPSSLILETFLKSDMLNAKARAKKIIVQLLNKELLGVTGDKNPLTQQAFSHKELLSAYKNAQALYTAPAYVSDVKFVESKGEMVSKDTIYYYLNKQMSSLGIGFLALDSGNNSVSSASISLSQLMKTINSIKAGLERIINHFYAQVLIDEGIPAEYAPTIKIANSEAMEFELKSKLVEILYSKLNCSLKTALEVLGYDITEEETRRLEENSRGVDKTFFPRSSIYTNSGNGDAKNGRPEGEETNKQGYDQEYNKVRPQK